MNEEKEKWINNILESTKGYQQPSPNIDVFGKIENAIYNPNTKPFSIIQLKSAAVAACLILLINIATIYISSQNSNIIEEGSISYNDISPSLISNYYIY